MGIRGEMSTKTVINLAKSYQLKIIDDYGKDPYGLRSHLAEAEKWAHKLFKMYPKANKDVVLLSVWLHDTGHYSGDPEVDHAVKSEKLAKEFLTGKISDDIRNKVCCAIRAHRCKDVMPKTIEERIVACVDSASHMTDTMYLDIAKEGRYDFCLKKIERDFKDIGQIPEVKTTLTPTYKNWVKLINSLKELGI